MVHPTCTRTVVVSLENGLHLAPASQIAQVAGRYHCDLAIRKGEKSVNPRSMLDLVTLVAEYGNELILEGSGDDAEDAIAALARLFDNNFRLEPES